MICINSSVSSGKAPLLLMICGSNSLMRWRLKGTVSWAIHSARWRTLQKGGYSHVKPTSCEAHSFASGKSGSHSCCFIATSTAPIRARVCKTPDVFVCAARQSHTNCRSSNEEKRRKVTAEAAMACRSPSAFSSSRNFSASWACSCVHCGAVQSTLKSVSLEPSPLKTSDTLGRALSWDKMW